MAAYGGFVVFAKPTEISRKFWPYSPVHQLHPWNYGHVRTYHSPRQATVYAHHAIRYRTWPCRRLCRRTTYFISRPYPPLPGSNKRAPRKLWPHPTSLRMYKFIGSIIIYSAFFKINIRSLPTAVRKLLIALAKCSLCLPLTTRILI